MEVIRELKIILDKLFSRFLPDKIYLSLRFKNSQGYWIDWKNPKTFCEKIQVLKLLSKKHPEFTKMVDKVDAKYFVADILGEEYIIPTLGVWRNFDDIDFDSIKEDFILKCTHDSSKGVIFRKGDSVDRSKIRQRMLYYQNKSFFNESREYPYKNVPRRLIAEKYLVNGNDSELMDYKFFCFNGTAKYVQIIADRTTYETIDFYDRNWQHQPFLGLNRHVANAKKMHTPPENYSKMFGIADKLAKSIDFPFVRVDLYNVNGRIYFGEITFFPGSGFGRFTPEDWNNKLGDMIKL